MKKFNWKNLNKTGGWGVKFHFHTEHEGEMWFDTIFSVWNAKTNNIEIGRTIMHGRLTVFHSAIIHSLTPGRNIHITPIWLSPRGEKWLQSIPIKVLGAEQISENSIQLTFE